jgi:hypothetical protein
MNPKTIVITIIAAVILMGLVFACLAIGWLLTGKSFLRRGTCGMVPQEKGKKKQQHCPICGAERICEEKDSKKEKGEDDDNDVSKGEDP